MKEVGIFLVVIALVCGGIGLFMDVSVTVPAQSYGYGISTPEFKVNNHEKMDIRRSVLIAGGIFGIIGILMVLLSPDSSKANDKVRHAKLGILDVKDVKIEDIEPIAASCMICPKCHEALGYTPIGASKCGKCGLDIDIINIDGEDFVIAVKPPVTQGFCHKCGTKVTPEMDFCQKCGTKLIRP